MELTGAMKYIYSSILTGLMIHFSPLSAEDLREEIALSFPTSELTSNREEVSLDEEFSLLDQEFEEFKEELSSLEEPLSLAAQPLAELALVTQENFVALEEEVYPSTSLIANDWIQDEPADLDVQRASAMEEVFPMQAGTIAVDLQQAFSASPVIYSFLLGMSIFAVCIWLYFAVSMRTSARFSGTLLKEVKTKLNNNQFEETLSLCEKHNTLFCKMVSSGIQSRRHGLPIMIEAMKAEGKRSTISFWQKLGLLSDIAIIAPMLGLLGTVLGMFYAFYNVNRSIESISVLFDGLGVSVGTTVAGLIVAILALILHSTAKYRLVRTLAHVENEAQTVAVLIDDRTSILKG
jgi:biopolymer transport protein ExbB